MENFFTVLLHFEDWILIFIGFYSLIF